MLRYGETRAEKKNWKKENGKKKYTYDVNANNIVISKLFETKTKCKYLIGYWDRFIKALVLPKMSGYVKTFKDTNKKWKQWINVFPCQWWETIRKI